MHESFPTCRTQSFGLMTSTIPASLSSLLASGGGASQEEAWAAFLAAHSRLLLFVARSFGGDHDAVMDRYVALIEHLSRDDYRRLRAFADDGRSEFSTWLVVVAQRICLDHRRARYGRLRSTDDHARNEHATRRQLADLVGVPADLVPLEDRGDLPADEALAARETRSALEAALATLPARDRLLIELRFTDDAPLAEIAGILGYPTRFHAYRRLNQALATLRSALAARGVVSPG